MINIREEDVKVFEQNGFTKEDVGKAVEHYRKQGMSDEKIQKRMNFRVSALRDNDSRRLMATDPNISSSERVNRINAYSNKEQAQYTRQGRAIQKQAEIAKRKEAHPIVYGMINPMFNPVANANDYYLKQLAENGEVTGWDILKQGAMGGLTGAGDALSVTGLGGAAKLAQGARAAKAADLAVKARNAGNIARATQLETMAGNLGRANMRGTMLNGATTFAAPVGGEQFGQVIADNQDPIQAIKNTAIAGVEGAALGALSKAAQPLLSKATKALNPTERVKADLIKQGKEPSKELIDKYIEEHPYLYGLYQTGENTAKGLGTTAIDTAALANMDYGLNTLEGTQQQSYGEHIKNYFPFLFMGGIPAALGLGKMGARAVGNTKAGGGIKQAVGNAVEDSEILSNLAGTGALSLGLEAPKGKAGNYYNVEKGLQGLKDNPINNLSPEERAQIEAYNNLTKEQGNKLYETFQTREEPVVEAKPETLTKEEIDNALKESNKITPEEKEAALNKEQRLNDDPDLDALLKEEYTPEEYQARVAEKNSNLQQTVQEQPKKRRGRPKGSKNKPKEIPQPVESDLRPVKNKTDVNTPKQDLTPVKSQSDMSGKTEYVANENAEPIVKNINANQLSFDFSKKPQSKQKIVKTNNTITPKQATQKTVEGSVNKSKAYRDLYNKKISKISGKMREVPEEFKPEENTEDISKFKVTKLKGGAAEGSDYLNKKDRLLDKSNTTKNVESEREMLEKEGQVWENGSSERQVGELEGQEATREYNKFDRDKEQITGESKYVTTDKELIKWWDEYKKLPEKERNAELLNKWKNLKPEKQDEFMDFVAKQEERDAALAKREYDKKLISGEETGEKPDVSTVNEIGRLGKALKENQITTKREKIYTQKEMKDGRKIINRLFKLPDNVKQSKKLAIDVNFKKFDTPEKLKAAYDKYIRDISLMPNMNEKAKNYAISLINDVAKKYNVKNLSPLSSVNKRRVNEILDNVKKYSDEGNFDKVLTYLKTNEKLLKEQKQYISNPIVTEAYSKMAMNKIETIDKAIAEGRFNEAEKLWKQSENNIRTAYTDFDIRKRYSQNRETGKHEYKGESWNNEVTDVDVRDRQYIEYKNKIENQIREGKIKNASEYINKGKTNGDLVGTSIKASELKNSCPQLKEFIDKSPDTVVRFEKENTRNKSINGLYDTEKNEIVLYTDKNKNTTSYHEFQHANDYKECFDNIDNKDYQTIVKANRMQAELRQEFINKNIDVYEVVKNAGKKGYTKNQILSRIKDENKKEIAIKLFEHFDNNKNDIIEQRARTAGVEEKPNGRRIGQDIETVKRTELWKKYEELAGEYDRRYPEYRGDNVRQSFRGNDRGTNRQVSGQIGEVDSVFDKLNEANKQPEINSSDFDVLEKQRIPELRKASRETDSLAVKTGLVTQENVNNRIKQLGTFYTPTNADIKLANGKNKGIDLTKDYNEKRNKKTGIIEKAKKNDFNDNVNPISQAAKNIYTKLAKLKHLDNVLINVEKLGREYKEGSVGKGEVAVNKHLLANAIWGNMSREFMETLSKGDIAKIAGENKDKYKYFKELHERTNKPDLIIPDHLLNKLLDGSGETIQEYMQRYGGKNFGAIKKASSEALNIANDFFKRRVLGTFSFFVNNRLGNQLMIAANSKNPKEYAESVLNAFKLKPKEVPPEILENSIAEAFEGATSRRTYTGYDKVDNFINLLKGVDINLTKIKPGAKRNWAKAANVGIALPNKLYNSVADGILNLNTKFENFERKQLFAQQVERTRRDLIKSTGRKMVTTQEAIKHINETPELRETIIRSIQDVLGDYSKFSKFERKYLKAVIPFYSWYRTITRHTIQLARKNPARLGIIAWQLKKMADDDSDLKPYQRGLGAFRIPLKDARSGKQLVSNKSRQIPWNTFGEVAEPNGKYSMVSPAIRVPIEAAKGSKFFNNSEITNDRYLRIENYNKDKKAKPTYKYYDIRTGKYLDKLPIAPRAGYITKEVARDINPLIFNSTTNLEAVAGGVANKFNINMPWDKKQRAEAGNWIDTDKSYDASLGGFNNGDVIGKKWTKRNGYKDITRYAGNNVTQTVKYLNRGGFSLGNKTELNKEERKAQEDEKIKRQQKKMKNKRKKAS